MARPAASASADAASVPSFCAGLLPSLCRYTGRAPIARKIHPSTGNLNRGALARNVMGLWASTKTNAGSTRPLGWLAT